MRAWLAFLFLSFRLVAQDVDAMFVLETTPGTEQAIGLLRPRELKEADRAAVIGFFKTAQVLQSLTDDRDLLGRALRQAGTRVAVGLGGAIPDNFATTVDLGSAIRMACREFGANESTERHRAVIVLFANEDPSLGTSLSSIADALDRAEARLFAVPIQRAPAPGNSGRRTLSSYPFPAATANILSALAKNSGGRVFRRNWDLKEILTDARKLRGELR